MAATGWKRNQLEFSFGKSKSGAEDPECTIIKEITDGAAAEWNKTAGVGKTVRPFDRVMEAGSQIMLAPD